MTPVEGLCYVAAGVGTFAIAAAAVGSTTSTLAHRTRRAVYDVDEAVGFIAERLSEDTTAVVSFDDVRAVVEARLELMGLRGVASTATDDDGTTDLVVLADDESTGWVLGRLEETGVSLTDEQVAEIMLIDDEYQRSIGTIGPVVA